MMVFRVDFGVGGAGARRGDEMVDGGMEPMDGWRGRDGLAVRDRRSSPAWPGQKPVIIHMLGSGARCMSNNTWLGGGGASRWQGCAPRGMDGRLSGPSSSFRDAPLRAP